MKRIGLDRTLDVLDFGGYIVYRDWFYLSPGYRLYNSGDECLGYITFDLWLRLIRAGIIIRDPATKCYSPERYVKDPHCVLDKPGTVGYYAAEGSSIDGIIAGLNQEESL